ncbi:MAG TPA: aminotransferase class III-fold pyridoxal phosphate-dependent enzyme [Vicinamibacterales bacterium]|nr:aminotransferase class III-fold pyridoxal phosphate-dependent enzyme [Vicinamibacterales bacterium]
MSLLDRAPRLGRAEAVAIARDLYGLDAEAQALPSERDQNFLLQTAARRYVLKLANALERPEILQAQNAVLEHLAGHTAMCPRIVRTANGAEIAPGPDGHLVRLVTWRPGVPLATVRHVSAGLLEDLGRSIGEIDRHLASFDHPALHRDFHWDLAGAIGRSRALLPLVGDAAWRAVVARALDEIDAHLTPLLEGLRTSIIHNDANDYNVIVCRDLEHGDTVSGLIDFGDMVHSYTVADPAVAVAYAVLNTDDPLACASALVRGYHQANPLLENEVSALLDLVKLRLCLSVAIAARQQEQRPDDEYLGISQEAIRRTLPSLTSIHPRLAEVAFRRACGMSSAPRTERIRSWLAGPVRARRWTGMIGDGEIRPGEILGLDLGVASPLVSGDPLETSEPALTKQIQAALLEVGARVGVGGYLEPRLLYSSPLFAGRGATDARRTIHLGLDLFAPAGTSVHAALGGVVHDFADNRQSLDYGPVVILEHSTDAGDRFYTLYGHLTRESVQRLERGRALAAGDRLGAIGCPDVNGGWTPHLHFQVITDLLDLGCDYPGVCKASEVETWAELSPDPNLLVGLPADLLASRPPDVEETRRARRARIGGNVRLSYRAPLKIVRGWMQYLYDDEGRRFLDAYNNVPHVGHCQPDVVRAAERQMRLLNTNTRYLHDALTMFADRLVSTLPSPLSVCYFVNSGSEANEVAVRLARAHTRRRDVVVLDAAYHGITTTLIEISPYKFCGPGGDGRAEWVHVAPLPDVFRGAYRAGDATAGHRYAGELAAVVESVGRQGPGVAAFLAETCPSVGGQIILPDGYLAEAYAHVRAAGGVCIADEVQTAYGRMGSHFYAFEAHGVVPDIVVLGKPIGNGYPLGAVVTTAEIAASLDNGMEFFSTFGGSTVSCAVGLAVLDVVQREHLQVHAERVGRHLLDRLKAIWPRHPVIGDVRGSGLFLGLELVSDPDTRTPARVEADYVVNRMREEGILIGTDGPAHNVLKIRPPMPFTEQDADLLSATLDRVLGEMP